jgi:hypothetical protein
MMRSHYRFVLHSHRLFRQSSRRASNPALQRLFSSSSSSNNARNNANNNTEFQKLPPDVQRELLRHVKKPATKATATTSPAIGASSSSRRTYYWLMGCVAFVSAAGSLPYWATQTIGNLTDRDEPLNASGVRRGAFANSGSKDAGRDPNWDWKNGRYVYPKGFAEHLKMQDPNQTDFGPDIGRMVVEEKKLNSVETKRQ